MKYHPQPKPALPNHEHNVPRISKPLSIAVDARPLAFPNSGIGRYTAALLREFAQIDATEHRFFLYSDRPVVLPFELPATWKLRQGSIRRRALSTPFAQLVFPLWALMDGADVFWSPRHHLPLLLLWNIQQVVTIHDVVWKRFPETMTRGGRLIESILMPATLRNADRVIAVSHFTAREINELFHIKMKPIDVIYEASSLDASRRQNSLHNRPYFLFVGSNEPRKNLKRLLGTYLKYLNECESPADLILVGSYQWGNFDLEEFIRSNNLQHHVELQRTVTDNTLGDLYSGALALLMPSLYEGFGLPLVEAMQWGTPIIAAATSAIPEIAGNAAILIDPLNEHDMCDAMCRLSTDRELRRHLSAQSKSRGKLFSWHLAAEQTLKTLESCA